MTAKQIIYNSVTWKTLGMTVFDCNDATHNATDFDDWLESGVLYEGTLGEEDFMAEVIKKPPHLSVTGVEEGGYERL